MFNKRAVLSVRKSELQQKIASGSDDLEDYFDLADLLVGEGNYDDAVKLLEHSLNLAVPNVQKARAALELGWLIHDVDELSKALPLADRSIELLSDEPESSEVIFFKALSLSLIAHCMRLSDEQAATESACTGLKLLERLIEEASDFDGIPIVHYEAARICNLLSRTERSVVLCAKYLKFDLNDGHRLACLIVYGEALRRERQFVDAERVLNEALQNVEIDKGMLPRIHFELGSTYRAAGQLVEARESFVEAFNALDSHPTLRDDPQFLSDIYWNIGGLCYELGDYEKAIKVFEKVLYYHSRDDGGYWNAICWLGNCHEAKGSYDEARTCYKQVLATPHTTETDRASAREGLQRLDVSTNN
jgi:tetratricopeptide (TPR) repeat protein